MFRYPLVAVTPAILLLTSCAVTEPPQYSEQESQQPTVIIVDTSLTPQQIPNLITAANMVRPRVKPNASSLVALNQSRNHAYLATASVNTSENDRTIYWRHYIVQQGDTAYSLGRRYCSRTEDIKSYNNLNSTYSLTVGQSIILPHTTC